ncbi:MAG: type I-E CRISPR-associated protein Cas6/Cse3/CasE [Eubacteriales bacterium]
MYLSKISLDQRSASVRQSLYDCVDMHRNIQKLFSESRKEAGVLYRVYSDKTGCFIYVQSEQAPVESEEVRRNGMKITASRDIGEIENSFIPGRQFGFNLLTMPCKKVSDGVSKNSRRRILRAYDERMEWLMKKGSDNGFLILNAEETEGEVLHSSKKTNEMYLHTTKFTGLLQITDAEKFKNAWRHGIGPDKAYGLGMLLLR